MRIISKFKDYYDSLMNHTDKEHTWVRQTNDEFQYIIPQTDPLFNHIHLPILTDHISYDFNKSIIVYCYYLLFCGEMIPFIYIEKSRSNESKNIDDLINDNRYIYEYKKFIDLYNQLIDIDSNNSWYKPLSYDRPKDRYTTEQIYQLFDKSFYKQYEDQLKQLHFNYQSPILIIHADMIDNHTNIKNKYYDKFYHGCQIFVEINPQLSKINFHKQLDCYQCYQRLDMFIFNELQTADKQTPLLSNDSIAQSKGFGHKYAFRKEPQNL